MVVSVHLSTFPLFVVTGLSSSLGNGGFGGGGWNSTPGSTSTSTTTSSTGGGGNSWNPPSSGSSTTTGSWDATPVRKRVLKTYTVVFHVCPPSNTLFPCFHHRPSLPSRPSRPRCWRARLRLPAAAAAAAAVAGTDLLCLLRHRCGVRRPLPAPET